MTTPGPPRGAARRDLILDATLQVVAEEGVAAVTHRRVAAVAGVPLAATTYWFTSKEDLIATAFGVAADRDIDRIRQKGAEFPDSHGGDTAAAIARILLDELANGRTMLMAAYVLMIEARRHPALRSISARWGTAYFDVLTRILSDVGSTRPELDARITLATLDGLLLNHLIGDGAGDEEELMTLVSAQVALLLPNDSVQPKARKKVDV